MANCPYCGKKLVLRTAYEVFNTNKSKSWGNMWVCSDYPKCDSYVGCHAGTEIPLGRPANARLRTLKKEAHKQFDPIWKSGLMSRKDAYMWLADMLNIPSEECHIGMFDIKQCQKAIHLCKRQTNPVISDYRLKCYGYENVKPTFTRGYSSKVN